MIRRNAYLVALVAFTLVNSFATSSQPAKLIAFVAVVAALATIATREVARTLVRESIRRRAERRVFARRIAEIRNR